VPAQFAATRHDDDDGTNVITIDALIIIVPSF
jgi:hypothetical protein